MTIEDAVLNYYGQLNEREGRKAEYRQLRTQLCGFRLDDVVAYVESRIADRLTCAELEGENLSHRKMDELRAAKIAAEKLLGRLHRISL